MKTYSGIMTATMDLDFVIDMTTLKDNKLGSGENIVQG